jgi:cytidine deaminase
MTELTNDELAEINHLIEKARSVVRPYRKGDDLIGDVGCALLSEQGNLYLGVCIAVGTGSSCAEPNAIGAMVTAGEYRIRKIVAVWTDGADTYVLSPCGHCRQFMIQVAKENLDTDVILDRDKVVKLADLLPYADWFHKIAG